MTQYQFCTYGPQEYYYPLFQKYRVEPTTGRHRGAELPAFHVGLSSVGPAFPRRRNDPDGRSLELLPLGVQYARLRRRGAYYAVQWHNVFPEPWDKRARRGPLHFQQWVPVKRWAGG